MNEHKCFKTLRHRDKLSLLARRASLGEAFWQREMIFIKNCYRTLSLAAHQEHVSSGDALLRGQGLFACYLDINL